MIQKLTLLGALFLTPVLTQLDPAPVVPDVRFDDGNDRFDLTAMVRDTNKMYRQHEVEQDEDDFRRNVKSKEEDFFMIDPIQEDRFKNIPISSRRLMKLRQALEKNAKKRKGKRRMENLVHQLHGNVSLRRNDTAVNEIPTKSSPNTTNEKEVLMNYAMPIVMNIDGYLKVPLI